MSTDIMQGYWIGEGEIAKFAPKPPHKKDLIYQGIISIGDWSEDGHSRVEMFSYMATHSIAEQQQAYHHSVELTGLRFHHSNGFDNPNTICTEYKDNWINAYHMAVLQKYAAVSSTKFGSNPMGYQPKIQEFAEMILWFISLSLPNFKYEKPYTTKKSQWEDRYEGTRPEFGTSVLNGWWRDLNVQFGYGLFDSDLFYGKYTPKDKSQSVTKKYLRLTKDNSTRYGRIVNDYYDIRTKLSRQLLTKEIHEWSDGFEQNQKLLDFIEKAEDKMIIAGERVWFASKKDAALFKLFF